MLKALQNVEIKVDANDVTDMIRKALERDYSDYEIISIKPNVEEFDKGRQWDSYVVHEFVGYTIKLKRK